MLHNTKHDPIESISAEQPGHFKLKKKKTLPKEASPNVRKRVSRSNPREDVIKLSGSRADISAHFSDMATPSRRNVRSAACAADDAGPSLRNAHIL